MTLTTETHLLVDGEWIPGAGPGIDVVDSRSGDPIASVPSADAGQVDRALSAARRAQHAWARRTAMARGDVLRQAADVLERHRDLLADLLVEEVGKPIAQARAEVDFGIGFLRYHADWDRKLEGQILAGDSEGEVVNLVRAPVGVVVGILAWNFPLAIFFRKVAPALLTGNTVVVKPSEVAPLTVLAAARLITEAVDIPPGVLNIVCGAGEVGAALVRSELTSMVSFTGHRDTGKRIMAAASNNLTRVSLELGGKAPAIVCADADLDLAVAAIVEARHTNAGQVCTSAERVLVDRSIADEFTARYVDAVGALDVGDPAAGADMGPMVSLGQLRKTAAMVEQAVAAGARAVLGRRQPDQENYAAGYWMAPTVLTDVTPDMGVMTEETFGPVTPILPVASLDDAIDVANSSRYGLSAYVFSRDYRTVMRAANDLDVGEIYVNRSLGESVHAHHAGVKQSGIGGEDGKWGLLQYTHVKTVYHHFG